MLPNNMRDIVLKLFHEGDRPVPSKSTISRLRLKIDVAWMLLTGTWLHAALDGAGLIVHVTVDSSPQGGHDYELLSLSVAFQIRAACAAC